ncbi:LytR C-terminal domain-containing protein [Demequina sp. NBRC 110055]|uniref:LytR C-terminal domain-containing protein n=1 Tax=Demequina sp. NBRC 110055 TaxID=1570344 RepID=UPI000A0711EC|nr:LytR C-terminal domain-containing protein [Demequina sp. NBRC 110055]
MPQEYDRDEFDDIADQGGPVGVHRTPAKWWTKVLPPLLALIAAGLVGYLVAVFLWNSGHDSDEPEPVATITTTPSAEATASPSASASPSAEPSAEPSASATPSETPSEEPEPEILFDTEVHVRNGAGISGLAGSQQEILEDAGFTSIEANNIDASLIPDGVNTVAYEDESLADTAQAIADELGIDVVSGDGTPGGADIEVLLASDPGN